MSTETRDAEPAGGTDQDPEVVEVNDYADAVVPDDKRRGTYQMVSVAVGWSISVSAFLVGGAVGGGLPFGQGVSAIIVGNAVLAIVASLVGLIGYRTGMTSYLVSRRVFGRSGSLVVSLVLGVLAMGFIGVLMDAFGNAFVALVPSVPWTVVVVLFAVAVTITALFGFKGLAWISRLAAPSLGVLAILGLVRIAMSDGGFGTAINATPTAPISFDAGVTAVIATWITGAALTCDIARYAKRGRDVVVAVAIGYVGGAAFFEFVAMISSTEAGTPDFMQAMGALGLLLPAVLVLVLALWTTTDNNVYSASLAFTNASRLVGAEVSKKVWVYVCAAIALAVAFMGFASNFLSFLLIIAVVTPPFAGVVIAHYWVRGGFRAESDGTAVDAAGVRVQAMGSWLAASLIAYFVDLPVEPVAALVIGGVLYAVADALVSSPADYVAQGA